MVTAYLAGRKIGSRKLETAGAAASLRLKLDRSEIAATETISPMSWRASTRSAGWCLTPRILRLSLNGGAELATFGNVNPRGLASFRQPVTKSWHGHALTIIQPTGQARRPSVSDRKACGALRSGCQSSARAATIKGGVLATIF